MALLEREPTSQERQAIRELRERWLGHIENVVNRAGFCTVTTEDLWRFDDPYYSPILKVALAFGGHRQPECVTAMGALEDLAQKNHWEMYENYFRPERTIELRAPIKRWRCLSCEGTGRLYLPFQRVVRFDVDLVERLCSHCHGRCSVEQRTDPDYDVCRIEYVPMFRRFIPKETADAMSYRTHPVSR